MDALLVWCGWASSMHLASVVVCVWEELIYIPITIELSRASALFKLRCHVMEVTPSVEVGSDETCQGVISTTTEVTVAGH